ncbi:MAG: hypothetical protein ABI595_03430 [Actinomycetota bacterium]
MEKSGGFDMSKLSLASKILLGAGILLLIDSFLSWQKVCVSDVLGDLADVGDFCVKANAWSGSGGWAGLIMGLFLIALLIWEAMQIADMQEKFSIGVTPSKLAAYLGFGVVAFGLIKFLFAVTNEPALFAFVGLILILAIGYGAWMKFQEPETVAAPPMAPGGTDGGFTA